MFVLGTLFGALATVVNIVFDALLLILLVNALLSWVTHDPGNPWVQFLDRVSGFVCNPIRRLFPTVISGLDLAPMIAMIAIVFLQRWLVPMLRELAVRMG